MSIVISIDRTGMAGDTSDYELSALLDARPLGIENYTPPALIAVTEFGPSSSSVDGEFPLRWRRPNTFHRFDIITDLATSESVAQAEVAEFLAAISRLRYTVTTTIGDSVKEWVCFPGSLTPADRTLNDLRDHDALWAVTLPCHPIST